MTGRPITMLWRRLLMRLKGTFSWPSEPTFSNEIDATAALFGPQSAPEDAGAHSTPDGRSG